MHVWSGALLVCMSVASISLRTQAFSLKGNAESAVAAGNRDIAPRAIDFNRTIPCNILMNGKTNFLTDSSVPENEVIKHNVKETIVRLHPGCPLIFYTDADCFQAVARVHSESLAQGFLHEEFGPFKSDVCRLAMLAEHGGYYFDDDIEVMKDVRVAIPASASLSSVIELDQHKDDADKFVFQAFLAAAPRHPAISAAMDNYEAFYKSKAAVYPRGTRVPLGPYLTGKAIREWLQVEHLNMGMMMHPSTHESAYFFKETPEWQRYALAMSDKRMHGGPGLNCKMLIGDASSAVGWSHVVSKRRSTRTCREMK